MFVARIKQVCLYLFSNFNDEWNKEIREILSLEEFEIFYLQDHTQTFYKEDEAE